MLENSQNSEMVNRDVLIFFCIVKIFHVIPPLPELCCDSYGLVRVFLNVVERFVSQLNNLAPDSVVPCEET
jgi:hypothetical protein